MKRSHAWMAVIGGALFGVVMGWLAGWLFGSVRIGIGLGLVCAILGAGYYASNLEKHGSMNTPRQRRSSWFVWWS
jgi:F0F1-type ATP synthase assembly protein I